MAANIQSENNKLQALTQASITIATNKNSLTSSHFQTIYNAFQHFPALDYIPAKFLCKAYQLLQVQYYNTGDIIASSPINNGYIIISGAIKKLPHGFKIKSKLKTIINTWNRAKAIDDSVATPGQLIGNYCNATNVLPPTGIFVALEKSTAIIIPTSAIIKVLADKEPDSDFQKIMKTLMEVWPAMSKYSECQEDFIRSFKIKDYSRGHILTSEGHHTRKVFLIIKGEVKNLCTKSSPYYKYLCDKGAENKKTATTMSATYELGTLSRYEWVGIDFTLEENDLYFFTAIADTEVTVYKSTVSKLLRMPSEFLRILRTYFLLKCGQYKEKIFRNQKFLSKMPTSELNKSENKASLIEAKFPFANKNMLLNIKKKIIYDKLSTVSDQNSPKHFSDIPSLIKSTTDKLNEDAAVEQRIDGSPQKPKYIHYLLQSIRASTQNFYPSKRNAYKQRPKKRKLQSLSKRSEALIELDIEKMKSKFRHFSICHRTISLTQKEERQGTPNIMG